MIEILLHILACYAIADFVYNFLPMDIGKDEYWRPIIPKLIAMGVAGLAAVGKELWDLFHDGEFISASDLTMDATGILAWLFIPLIGQVIYQDSRSRGLINNDWFNKIIFKINFVSVIRAIRWWMKKRRGVSSREFIDD